MEDTAKRIARTEALFRDVNERVAEAAQRFESDEAEFVCECADPACTQPVSMKLEQYEAIRADPTRFAVARGHEVPDIEKIVEDAGEFLVIEKHAGDPAELARERDPRS